MKVALVNKESCLKFVVDVAKTYRKQRQASAFWGYTESKQETKGVDTTTACKPITVIVCSDI